MFDVNPHAGHSRRRQRGNFDRGPRSHAMFRDHATFRDMVGALRGGGPAIRRGDIRPLILRALQREPMHGYQVIQDLEAASGGRWRPSAGSVYPTLQQLEDEGLVRSADVDGRRVYSLTDDGRAAAAQAVDPVGHWFGPQRDPGSTDIRGLAIQLFGAVMQVSKAGSPQAQREARDVIVEARRRMYRILADDADVDAADTGNAGPASVGAAGAVPDESVASPTEAGA